MTSNETLPPDCEFTRTALDRNGRCIATTVEMSYVEYNHLLFEISQRLDQLNEHEHIILMCRGLVASRPEDIPNALSLFRELEDRNNLAIDKVELWKELLKAVGEWSLFQKVRKFEDKRKEYQELLEQISRALDESNQLQQLISVCTARETLDENERNTQVVRILFEKLERRGLFAFGRLDFLKGILSGIERQDLVMKVQDFEKRRIDEDDFERRKGNDHLVFCNSYFPAFFAGKYLRVFAQITFIE